MKNKPWKQRMNCIIDTDPGVDDAAAFALSLYDDVMDIRLITTVNGNLDVDVVTRNALHILEMFKRTEIPVVKGASKPMVRPIKHAMEVHKEHGMGGYIPPKTVKTKPINKSAVDAMYETIKQYKNNICLILQGPTTNVGELFTKYPEVKLMINHIYYEGCAAWDSKYEKNWKNYISFNASCDPDALKIVVESGIPVTMCPSRMGRELAHFTEEEVYKMREFNDVGKWLYEMYGGYWERNYKDRRAATNDTCAVLAMRFPKLFKLKRATVTVDTGDETPGKTVFKWNRKGNVEYAYAVNRKKFHQLYFNAISKLNMFNLTEYLDASNKAKIKEEENKQLLEGKVVKPKTTKKQSNKTSVKPSNKKDVNKNSTTKTNSKK